MDTFGNIQHLLDVHGRLIIWPSRCQPDYQQRVLECLADQFVYAIDYNKQQVIDLLCQL